MVRVILFDCFGVIITDALKAVIDELNAADSALAQRVMDVIHANNRGMLNSDESNRQIADLLGIGADEWRHRIEHEEVKDEHVLAYIRELKDRGYKTALLSNIGSQGLARRFSDQELKAYFDAVVISGELGVMKPEPEIYLHAAKILGVEPDECVMIDDREAHCDGARAVGMLAILYGNYRQAKQALEHLLS
jgi:putative hydrolase of the HAD superfamily